MSGYILIVMFIFRVALPIVLVLLAGSIVKQKKMRMKELS